MANLSEDIQCAGSDTRPPMLDMTDFASWQQRIRLYCQGKENGVNILKSIDKGPFQTGTVREPLAEGTKGAPHLGPERPRDISTLINHYTDAKDIWDNVKMLLEGSELTKEDWESKLYDDFEHFRQHKGETIHDYYVRFAKLINNMRNIKMTMSRMQLNSVSNDCDAFDSDVDEAPTIQNMFMANLSFADPVTDEAGPSYDSDILSEYVKDNAVPVIHSNVSSVPNDAYMMIYNDMFEPHAQSISNTSRNTVVENLLTAELATYTEQVELYERRAKFELTEREQKINEQSRLVISDRNFKEETLKKELHSIKLQLASTINHNKSMVE
uniref:Retrovirus-related Pol polyprotein from transposon TNT 1-94 n=1 Tax=Tanacetum cinerariifolium TaxID=118510 RepID=A0A699JAM3_TANCI|nr:retrovirus-related Pol polyprotein from transposon TNT 1-94 [Tanacetum cinerariifolium]